MSSDIPPPHVIDQAEPEFAFHNRAKRKIRLALFAVTAVVLLVIGAATLVPIGGAVIASGEILPESKIKRVAHPTGGVIAELYVSDGDAVKAGALLLRLESEVSGIDALLSQRSLDQLLATRARLLAEVDGASSVVFPDTLRRRGNAAQVAIKAEQRRFALNREVSSRRTSQHNERVKQLRRQTDGYEAQTSALLEQQRLIEPELVAVRQLKERGYVTIRRLNELEREAIQIGGSIGALRANIAQTEAAIAEAQEQNIQVEQTARAQAATQLAEVEAAIATQSVSTAGADDRFKRSTIRAPSTGVVDKLAYTSAGEVLRPVETILEIVPLNELSIIEGSVSPFDIDRIGLSQRTRVRLSASGTSTAPELVGYVSFISADPVADPTTNLRFYRVRVTLDQRSQQIIENMQLVSGMPAELFIETESRSMLSYISRPIRDQLARAFRN